MELTTAGWRPRVTMLASSSKALIYSCAVSRQNSRQRHIGVPSQNACLAETLLKKNSEEVKLWPAMKER